LNLRAISLSPIAHYDKVQKINRVPAVSTLTDLGSGNTGGALLPLDQFTLFHFCSVCRLGSAQGFRKRKMPKISLTGQKYQINLLINITNSCLGSFLQLQIGLAVLLVQVFDLIDFFFFPFSNEKPEWNGKQMCIWTEYNRIIPFYWNL